MDINNNIKNVCNVAVNIKKCMDDNIFFCNELNKLDKTYLRENFYKSNKTGVIRDIWKDIAREIILDDIDETTLLEIIELHKSKNPDKIKLNNPYQLLNPLINKSLKDINEFGIELENILKDKIGDVKSIIWSFDGARFQGQDHYCILFYNKNHKTKSDGIQIYFDMKPNMVEYGVYDYNTKNDIERIQVKSDDFDIEDFYNFIENNKDFILNETIEKGMTFIDGAKFILERNLNKPMTAKEIWDEISIDNLVKSDGKTPQASLNTIILNNCVDSPVTNNKSRNVFKIVDKNPMTFQLNYYMEPRIKETLLKNGFITIDMLKDIFEKNGLKFDI